MDPKQMLDAIAVRMAAGGTDARALGLALRFDDRDRKWIRVTMPPTLLQGDCGYEVVSADDKGVASACRRIARWRSEWQGWHDALLDAHSFIHGAGDRPFMVDAVADRHLAAHGFTWAQFSGSLAVRYRRPAVMGAGFGGLPDCYREAFRTYERTPVEIGDAGYYRRSHDLAEYRGIGATQGVIARPGRRNLTMDIVIAPGILWKSSGAPMVYVSNQTFPAAVQQGVRGRRLVDVVGADAFDVEGLDVLSMRHDGRRTVIQVRDVRIDASQARRAAHALPMAA